MSADPRKRRVRAKDVVALLNQAAAADPVAMLALINARVPCNDQLLAHPTIQTGRSDAGEPEVGVLGILNGIFGTFDDGWGCIMAQVDDDGAAIRFLLIGGRPERPPAKKGGRK